jgi:hypothetical protein
MSHDKITTLISAVAKALNNQEKLAIPLLNIKLHKIAEAHPYDQTVLAVANIISKMDDNSKSLISKGEFKDLYQKTYTNHTKFAEYFSDELGEMDALIVPKLASKYEKPIENTYQLVSDPILSQALDSVFNEKIPLKLFSKELGETAKMAVNKNLEIWNLKASKLEVDNGNEKFIVIKADYDTPKGITSILVPVEIQNGKTIDPSIFMANEGPQDLNYISIKSYVTTHAGDKLRVNSSDVVNTLTSIVIKNADVSSVELALTRLNASKEIKADFFSDAVLGLSMPSQIKNAEVSLPKLGQFQSFAEKFESPLGYANLQFGNDKVNLGRDVISRFVTSLGFKNAQLNISDANEDTIIYAVSLNNGRVAFNVPVKFANNRLINPEIIVCNGSIFNFTKDGIRKMISVSEKDYKAAAATSAQYGLKPDELIANIRSAMIDGNYDKAEDALNILAESGNVGAYKAAFSIFASGLSIVKQASGGPEQSCSMITANANSEHPICGHTNLPIHKVYQDEHGHCHPLYRRAVEENYDGAYFMNSKIFG